MSDIPKFIAHFKRSAAYHRQKAEQAETEAARLEALLPGVRPTKRAADATEADCNNCPTWDKCVDCPGSGLRVP